MTKPAPATSGARRGRPPLSDDPANTVRLNVFLTKEQQEKFRRLGGSAWLRRRIESAREP